MRRNTRIRGFDGAIRNVNDDYVLRGGEGFVIGMTPMDARRFMIHDGHGNPAGQRPDFLFSDANEQAEQARRGNL